MLFLRRVFRRRLTLSDYVSSVGFCSFHSGSGTTAVPSFVSSSSSWFASVSDSSSCIIHRVFLRRLLWRRISICLHRMSCLRCVRRVDLCRIVLFLHRRLLIRARFGCRVLHQMFLRHCHVVCFVSINLRFFVVSIFTSVCYVVFVFWFFVDVFNFVFLCGVFCFVVPEACVFMLFLVNRCRVILILGVCLRFVLSSLCYFYGIVC